MSLIYYDLISYFFREDLIGVESPVPRTEDDFDPGAMFHIVGAYSFMR